MRHRILARDSNRPRSVLCKIHNSAYDVNILGVSPDYRVHIRADVLREHDGPMFKWGLQEMDRAELWVGHRRAFIVRNRMIRRSSVSMTRRTA